MALLRSQRNELLRLVVEAGFNPNHFKWTHTETADVAQYGGSDAMASDKFAFGIVGTEFILQPGRARDRESRHGDVEEWLLPNFKDWLTYLRREVDAPDLWKEAQELGRALAKVEAPRHADPDTDDVPLVGEERKRFLEGVSTVRRQLEASDAEPDQKAQMVKVLDRVEEAGGAVNRKWLTQTVFGAVLVVVIEGALTKENGLWLLSRLAEAFNAVHLFGEATVRALGQ